MGLEKRLKVNKSVGPSVSWGATRDPYGVTSLSVSGRESAEAQTLPPVRDRSGRILYTYRCRGRCSPHVVSGVTPRRGRSPSFRRDSCT